MIPVKEHRLVQYPRWSSSLEDLVTGYLIFVDAEANAYVEVAGGQIYTTDLHRIQFKEGVRGRRNL